MKELRELCESRDEEWVRNEMQRREDASRKRHEDNIALEHKTVEQQEKK